MGIARGMVQTVRGPIPPETLGATLMHEHVFCDITPPELAAQVEPDVEITLEKDRKSTRLNSSHIQKSRMPSSA